MPSTRTRHSLPHSPYKTYGNYCMRVDPSTCTRHHRMHRMGLIDLAPSEWTRQFLPWFLPGFCTTHPFETVYSPVSYSGNPGVKRRISQGCRGAPRHGEGGALPQGPVTIVGECGLCQKRPSCPLRNRGSCSPLRYGGNPGVNGVSISQGCKLKLKRLAWVCQRTNVSGYLFRHDPHAIDQR
jgi:hypothetical protein